MASIRDVLPGAIRAARARAGLSQHQLAGNAGLARGAVGEIERGEREVTAQELAILALALDTTADELLSDAEPAQRLAMGLRARPWWQPE